MSTPVANKSTVQAMKARSPEPRHRLDHFPAAVGGGHAFKGVMLFGRAALLFAPLAVQVIHLHADPVGVDFAGAKYNYFLLGTAMQAQLFKQVVAHGGNPFRYMQFAIKMLGCVLGFDVSFTDG